MHTASKMHAIKTTIALLVLEVVFVCSRVHRLPETRQSKPEFIECANSDECDFDSCCVIGMMRFSTPMCQKRQQLQETCRPEPNEAFNATLVYPVGPAVVMRNMYQTVCPCDKGLICDDKLGKCVGFDSNAPYNHNHVHEGELVDD